jgi:hypothetical protein
VEAKEEAAAGRLPLVDCTLHVERRIIALEAARSFGIDGRDKNDMNRPLWSTRVDSFGEILMAVCVR